MPPTLRHRNATLFVDNSPLESGAVAETYLTADATSTTLAVKNITGFAINQLLLIEELGGENAEIILTHASSAPSGTTVTLASSLAKTHSAGSKVRVILYNQFELSHATTAAGSKTVLTVATTANANPPSSLGTGLIAVDPTTRIQAIASSEHTDGYYFARYKNSITSGFSAYTDALLYGGWGKNAVGYLIDTCLRELGITLSEKITRFDCYTWITECLDEITGKQLFWPEHFSYNATLDQMVDGTNEYDLPADIYDTDTRHSVLAVRLENVDDSLTYLSPIEFEEFESDPGTPLIYTVRNGKLALAPTPDANADSDDIYIDYAKAVTIVDSDGDTIDLDRYDIVQPYLTWRMKMKALNNSNLDVQDGYYLKHKERLNDAIRTKPTTAFKLKPRLNRMRKR